MKKILLLGTICFTFLTGCLGSDVDQLFFNPVEFGNQTCLDKIIDPTLDETRLSYQELYNYAKLSSCVIEQTQENSNTAQCYLFLKYGMYGLSNYCNNSMILNCQPELDACFSRGDNDV